MKKILPTITVIAIILAIIGWQSVTHSQSKLPYPTVGKENNPSVCVQSIANEIYLMKLAHNQHFQSIIEQEKPTSEIVAETYESLRTYRCWLDYLCEAVLYSGTADSEQMKKDKSNGVSLGVYLGTMPGCVSGEKVEIPTTKLKYMSQCKVFSSQIQTFGDSVSNYDECRNLVRLEFSEPNKDDLEKGSKSADVIKKIKESSAGMITIETALKKKAAEQKGTILADKLSSIILKMHFMEGHVNQLNEYMEKFDQRLTCYITKCD